MNNYLFVLGRHTGLSCAELSHFCDEVFFDPDKALLIGENLKFENPRNIPRDQHQLFLDRLGGLIRYGEILGEFPSKSDLLKYIFREIEKSEKLKVGFSVFGGGKNLLSEIIYATKDHFEKIRIENHQGKNLTSGQIFERKMLQKAQEFIVWQNGNTFLLAKTIANQNLRNYTLRDRQKKFRDAHMGMLPPKLAQILINLIKPAFEKNIIWDPFCGSGTVNIEAAIMGYETLGSDLNPEFVKKSAENFVQMSEKFRYESDGAQFFPHDAKDAFPTLAKDATVIVTEGFLGYNFTKSPTEMEIKRNADLVLGIWKKFFKQLEKSSVTQISGCLPAWNAGRKRHSIIEPFLVMARQSGFDLVEISPTDKTYFYERDKTFVSREIFILSKGL